MPPAITGLVLTYNGERLLDRCLASLSFCDRILVVDSFSTDRTVDMARAAGAEVLQRTWEGPGPQFCHALSAVDTEWVFSLDQDEICTEQLRRSVQAAVCAQARGNGESPTAKAGYWTSRRSWYFDRFMRHSGWYPDYLLRLFRPGKMTVHVAGAHYSFHPKGATGRLRGDILHYPYNGFRQHLDKINSYAEQGAHDLRARGRKGGVAVATAHGMARFLKLYLFKLGFLDGRAGFINAVHGAFYAFLKYIRVGEGHWGAPFDHH